MADAPLADFDRHSSLDADGMRLSGVEPVPPSPLFDGFLIRAGDVHFVFPLAAVVEVTACRSGAVAMGPRGRGWVALRGRPLPVVDLAALYELHAPASAAGNIVVIQVGLLRFGVLVQRLEGQQRTVVKPLLRPLDRLRGISGSSILDGGEVALILDVESLGRLAADAEPHPDACTPCRAGGQDTVDPIHEGELS